jgi:solute carrier family 35 protein F5
MLRLTSRITYIDTAGFTVYLIPTLLRYWRGDLAQMKRPVGYVYACQLDADKSSIYQPLPQDEESRPRSRSYSQSPSSSPLRPPLAIDLDQTPLTESPADDVLPKLTIAETARVAAWWAAVWFAANWAVNASLAWTSVASVTILSSTSGESSGGHS